MLRNAPLVAIGLDRGLAVTEWSELAGQLFAVPREAALGRTIAELLPVDGGEGAWRARLAQHGGPNVWTIDRAGAETLRLEVWTQVSRDAAGEPDAFVIYGHDVTAREAVARRRALESTMLAAVKTNLDLAVWAIDRKGTFLYQEGKGVISAGLAENQFLGMNLFDLYQGSSGSASIRRALAGELLHDTPEAQHGLHWENWYVPVDAAASEAAVVGVTLNVTNARQREAELLAKLDVIEKQQEVIRELSTPIIEVWDGVLTLPIVGLVDSARTAELMDDLLQAVARTRARFAILDLTGVQVVDTGTASHLLGLIRAIGLLGAEGVLTGISPVVAQTIVALGVDLSHVAVFAKLRDALGHCITKMNARR